MEIYYIYGSILEKYPLYKLALLYSIPHFKCTYFAVQFNITRNNFSHSYTCWKTAYILLIQYLQNIYNIAIRDPTGYEVIVIVMEWLSKNLFSIHETDENILSLNNSNFCNIIILLLSIIIIAANFNNTQLRKIIDKFKYLEISKDIGTELSEYCLLCYTYNLQSCRIKLKTCIYIYIASNLRGLTKLSNCLSKLHRFPFQYSYLFVDF